MNERVEVEWLCSGCVVCGCQCCRTMRLPVARQSWMAFCILSSHGSLSSSFSEWPPLIFALASDSTHVAHSREAGCQLYHLTVMWRCCYCVVVCVKGCTVGMEIVGVLELGVQPLAQQLAESGLSKVMHGADNCRHDR